MNNSELLTLFGFGHEKSSIAKRSLNRLLAKKDTDLIKYIPIYKTFKEENKPEDLKLALYQMQAILKWRIAELKNTPANANTIASFVEYVLETADNAFDSDIKAIIDKAVLSRSDFTLIEKTYPNFAAEQIAKRTLPIDLKTNGDEFTLGEIGDELKTINDWIDIDPDATRKLNFVRLRINEQRNPPMTSSEIVPDPDLVTLLMIPKNASVLVDFSVSEYSLQWNFKVQDTATKKTKTINGNKKLKKIECKNIRYQNVFGGTGALYNFPNSNIQSICQDSAGVDFDKARTEAIKSIAKEVLNDFIPLSKVSSSQ